MFDTNELIDIGLRKDGPLIKLTLRWPTDEEWLQHNRKRKAIRKDLGRGSTEFDVDSRNADLYVYDLVKQNGAPPLTGDEATQVISALAVCSILNVELGNEEGEVELQILGGEAKHWLRIPSMDQVRQLQKSHRQIQLPYNRTEVRINLEGAAQLWDKCMTKVEGYAAAVPNIHKNTAITALITAIEQEMTARYDERNF